MPHHYSRQMVIMFKAHISPVAFGWNSRPINCSSSADFETFNGRDRSEENLRSGSEPVTCYFNPTHALGATFSVMDNGNLFSSSPCSVCSEVLQRKQRLFFSKDGQFDYDHHKTAESLRQSRRQLCYICTTVWTSLSMAEKEIILTALDRKSVV